LAGDTLLQIARTSSLFWDRWRLVTCEGPGLVATSHHDSRDVVCWSSHPVLQSLLVSILAGSGVLDTTEDQKNLANFLICAEMLPAAIGMLFAFPYLEYKGMTECRLENVLAHAEVVRRFLSLLPLSDVMCLVPPSDHGRPADTADGCVQRREVEGGWGM
jgi:hypothetical protein